MADAMQVANIRLHTTRGMEAQRHQYLSRYCQWMRTVGDTVYVLLDDVAQLHDGVVWQSVASHKLRVRQCFQRTCVAKDAWPWQASVVLLVHDMLQ